MKRSTYYVRWIDQIAWNERPDDDQVDYIRFTETTDLSGARLLAQNISSRQGEAEVWRIAEAGEEENVLVAFFENGEDTAAIASSEPKGGR